MIIVAGHLRGATRERDAFLARSRRAIELARSAPGNHDFVVAADPIEPARVNIYERWTDRASLTAFRGNGPNDELQAFIESADVDEFDVLRPEPPVD